VEHGPIPPHERTWRHPSELAAEERELVRAQPVASASRVFALTTGTMGLLAIAVVFLLVTPGRQPQPVAVSATTTPSQADDPTSSATIAAVRRTDAVDDRADATPAALATPIGASQYAVMLRAALPIDESDFLEVVLPSGRVTSGRVVSASASADAVLVHLDDPEPGPEVADHRPHDREVVTVMASPPIQVALADLDDVDVAEGTAVVDADGRLVGLCSERGRGEGVRLVEVPPSMADPASP
jgi:hypothetical protein